MFASRRRPADPATRGQDPTLQKHGSGHPSATCSESVRFDPIMATFFEPSEGGPLRRLPREPAQNASEGSPGGIRQPRNPTPAMQVALRKRPATTTKMATKSFMSMHVRIQPSANKIATKCTQKVFSPTKGSLRHRGGPEGAQRRRRGGAEAAQRRRRGGAALFLRQFHKVEFRKPEFDDSFRKYRWWLRVM